LEDDLDIANTKMEQKKNFLRTCHNLLPTEDNLLRRKVVKEPCCPICETEPETVLYALWGCLVAMDV
jgi:hypothetical protein